METILGLILQLLILGCQIAVCILGYVLVTRGTAPQKEKEPDAAESALAEEERRMQEQMKRMMDGMNNILGYDGHPQGDRE
mgnify:CR=1 FL=1